VPIGPQCSVADVRTDLNRATIYMSGQQISGAAESVAPMLGMDAKNVRVIFYEGGSSYGTAQLTEAWYTSALVSKTIGKPVRIQWMRWDQHGFDEFGPAAMFDVKAGIDANGKIVGADWVSYGQASTAVKTVLELTGVATWPSNPGSGGGTPSDAAVYTVPNRRVLAKTQPLLNGSFKCSPLRAPNAPQSYFAGEQMIDELAKVANMDPIAFRRQNIDGTTVLGSRWLSVMDASTMAAGWQSKVAASNLQSGDVVTGRGFGFGTFASTQVGLVADVEVNKKTGKMVVKHLYMAQNNGVTINPQLVANQMSGAAIQGLSRAMYEQVTFTKERITSIDWVSYPLLRFADSPKVTLVNVHPGKYTTVDPGSTTTDVREGNTRAFAQGWTLSGSGEPPTAAVGSAVANAFFDATGARIRQAPMNSANVRNALRAAGIS
jgi:CO/xanthine dehydrogenase Mo-binding subunit